MASTKATAITTALERLERALSEGVQQYFERSDGGRQAAVTQLIAIEEFLTTVFQPSHTQPLCTLLHGLGDLDRKVTPPIFHIEIPKGRAPDSTDREMTKVQASLTVQLLFNLGFRPLKTTEELVAEVLKECGVPFTGRDPKKTVRQWRYELNKALKRDPESEKTKTYRDLLAAQGEAVEDLLHEIQSGPIDRREAARHDVRDRILYTLCVALMWAGDANRPADAVNARWKVQNTKVKHEVSLAWPALHAKMKAEREAYEAALPKRALRGADSK